MASTNAELTQELERLQSELDRIEKTPVSKAVVNGSAYHQHRSNEWPVEQLKRLENAYGSREAVDLYCRKGANGRLRVTGMGPALIKIAALSGDNNAMAIAREQGLMKGNYGPEQLEKEFGFVPATSKRGPNGQVRKAALAEGSGQTGGYTVPPQFQSELLTIAAEEGFIEQRAKVMPMTSRTAQWPMLDVTTAQSTGTSPYFGGILASWNPEAATLRESEPAFRQTEWTAWDLVLYTVSSNQLLQDNGIGLDAMLTQLFGQAMTWYKEYAFLRGTGTGSTMPLGILNSPATIAQARTTSNRFLLADAAAMMSHLQVNSWDSACWIMHQSVVPQLIQMVGGGTIGTASTTNIPGNQLAWMNPIGDGKGLGPTAMKLPNTFLHGLPVYYTEKLPSLGTRGDVVLADLSKYVIGNRMETQIDVSPHFLFNTNQMAWRVICRCDGKPWLNSYITDANGWTVSPFVILAA